MSVREMATKIEIEQLFNTAIASDTTTNTDGVDGADFELGLTFIMSLPVYVAGDFSFTLEESDDDGVSDAYTAVPAKKIIHKNGVIVDGSNASAVISAVAAAGDILTAKLGVFSNKRYVRAVILSANSADATPLVEVIKASENCAAGVGLPNDTTL
jgi:hypothetical protein